MTPTSERQTQHWDAVSAIGDEMGRRVSGNQSFDFGPYAQILRTLLPRTRVIYLYAPDGDLLWSSDGADSADLHPVIVELLRSAKANPASASAGGRHLLGDAPAYTFLLRDELGAVLGVTAILCRPVSGDSEAPAFEAVERTLAPLIVLVRRDLGQQRVLVETGRFNIADAQEMQWLLDVTQVEDPAGAGGDGLQALLDAFVTRADCELALLHAPQRRLERSSVRGLLRDGELDTLRAVVSKHLNRVAQLQQRTLIINQVRDNGAGGLVPFRILCVPLQRHGQEIGVVVAFNRATGRAFANRDARMLERLAPRLVEIIDMRFDSTTGLLTRHAFDEHASGLLARNPDGARAIVYADMDQLHIVNDLYGFSAGDTTLAAIARAWRAQELPPESAVARLAGDRFVALLEGATLDSARAWAEATRLAIAEVALPPSLSGITVAASFGVAALAAGGTLEHALAGAESACQQAKESGRNRVEVFATVDGRLAQQQGELRLQRQLLEAFDKGRFQLYAQPLVPLWDPSRPVHYEILLRLLDARSQPVAAERFMAVAARHQLLGRIDQWVLNELLARLATCGASLAQTSAVFSINLSGQSLLQADLADQIRLRLAAARIAPSILNFELSETAVTERLAETERFLNAIGALGCSASIDDFGTGGGALAHLKSLKVAALKIDGVFIRDIMTNARSESMVRAVLQIARQLELQTVAECVESLDAAAHLATLGITYGQGIALGEPRPLTEILDELMRKVAPKLTDAVARTPANTHVH